MATGRQRERERAVVVADAMSVESAAGRPRRRGRPIAF